MYYKAIVTGHQMDDLAKNKTFLWRRSLEAGRLEEDRRILRV